MTTKDAIATSGRQGAADSSGAAALAYAARGWPVFPCRRDKRPYTPHGFKEASCDPEVVRSWWRRWPKASIGIATGAAGLVVIDIDVKNGAPGEESWRALLSELGSELEDTAIARTPSGGRHLYYSAPGSWLSCSIDHLGRGIDVRAVGGYTIAPRSLGVHGVSYEWLEGHGPERLRELPSVLSARLEQCSANTKKARGGVALSPGVKIAVGTRNTTLFRDACAMRRRGHTRSEILAALAETNRRCQPALATAELEGIAASAMGYEPDERGERVRHPRTDAGNAELFCELNGTQVRFDHGRGVWFVWDGQHWRADGDGRVYRLAVQTARRRYGAAPEIGDLSAREAEAKFAIGSENRQRLEAMLRLASCQLPIATSGEVWNRDPLALAAANGVLDLECGRLRPGCPEEMISLTCGVRFDPAATCARWQRFLREVFSGDEELVDWIWRVVGYLLSGLTSEQCFFVCYGIGANGKSRLLNVLRALLGSYAYNAPFATFEAASRGAIPNDLAALVGRRLVTSSETSEDTRLNEARMKMLSGGDPVTARFLHREFFTFVPVAKFMLAVNHKPRVRDYSHGFWRRMRLIPFEARFEGAADDKHLEEKLLAELPGILAWAVRGCLAWRVRGLEPPAAVRVATAGYRADSDPLAEFLAESCESVGEARLPAAEAFEAYGEWASSRRLSEDERLGRNAFYSHLENHYPKRHTKAGNLYLGVRLCDPDAPTLDQAVKG